MRTLALGMTLVAMVGTSAIAADANIDDRLVEEPLHEMVSSKRIKELEWCAAHAMLYTAGIPKGIYYDGEHKAYMFSHRLSEYKPFLVIVFEEGKAGTSITITGRNADPIPRFLEHFLPCA